MRRCSAPDIFQRHYRVMTSKNGADFVHFVMPAQAPASQNGQSRDKKPKVDNSSQFTAEARSIASSQSLPAFFVSFVSSWFEHQRPPRISNLMTPRSGKSGSLSSSATSNRAISSLPDLS